MRKCPKCNSLVGADATEHCGVPLEAFAEEGISAAATVALSPEQIARLTGGSPPSEESPRPRSGRTTLQATPPARPPSTGFAAVATRNRAADRAFVLGLLAILPLFPIALAAFVYGILGLSHAAQGAGATGRGKAWLGVVSGALFGVVWTAVTVSVLLG
jgi:hypothetical protein